MLQHLTRNDEDLIKMLTFNEQGVLLCIVKT
jgi:hypothetical protein